ncbi:MAG: DUF1385 domain-containing protein [Pseudomonadota bacterium]
MLTLTEGSNKINVGGQAVIEGVMMRAPKSMTIAVRKPDGSIVVKEDVWRSISEKLTFLKWPFFRGSVAIFEALINGIQALTFSASQAFDEEEDAPGGWSIFFTIFVALGLALFLFVALPHLLSGLVSQLFGRRLGVEDILFHIIDGIIKIVIFIGYIWLISLSKEIRRVFEYHGAEHKSIYAYEAGESLTVENAKKHSTLHPRCGTAFILIVLLISIVFFSIFFPFMPLFTALPKIVTQMIHISFKILLMFPIAGIAYEFIKYSGKKMENPLVRMLTLPGLWMQKLTTREPSDDQLEIALAALSRAIQVHNEAV